MDGTAAERTTATINVNAPSTGVYTIAMATNDAGHDDTGTYRLDVAGASFLQDRSSRCRRSA
jgi:hypothetical protein